MSLKNEKMKGASLLAIVAFAGFVGFAHNAMAERIYINNEGLYDRPERLYVSDTYVRTDAELPSVITGGVGDEGAAYFDSIKNNYDLKLTFTGRDGMYLSNVNVNVTNRYGQSVVDTQARGPMVLAKLSPGRYTVRASIGGQERVSRITVRPSRLSSLTMNFPINEDDVVGTNGHNNNVDAYMGPDRQVVVRERVYGYGYRPSVQLNAEGHAPGYYDDDYHIRKRFGTDF